MLEIHVLIWVYFLHPTLIGKFIYLLNSISDRLWAAGTKALKTALLMVQPWLYSTTYRLNSTRKALPSIKRVFQPCLNLGGPLCCWFSVLPFICHQDYMSSLPVWFQPITRFYDHVLPPPALQHCMEVTFFISAASSNRWLSFHLLLYLHQVWQSLKLPANCPSVFVVVMEPFAS